MGLDKILDLMLRSKVRMAISGTLLALGIGSCVVGPHLDRDVYVGKVTEKPIKRYDKSDKYLIFVKLQDGSTRVLENTDSLFEGKFNSSDIQAQLEIAKTYEFKTYGWRIPFLSNYENVVGIKEVPPRQPENKK